jgi:phosphotransferase system enzyme I (PtsI)
LLGLGLRSFSMHPSQLARVKQKVLRTDASRWAASISSILAADRPADAAQQLRAFFASAQAQIPSADLLA